MDEDTDELLKWSPGDLAAKLAKDDPDEDSFVLRVVAARIGARAAESTDPLHLVHDMGRALRSLKSAVEVVVPKWAASEVEDPETAAIYRAAVDNLHCAGENLVEIHGWF